MAILCSLRTVPASHVIYNSFCATINGITTMAEQRVLVSWIGHADLLAMTDDLGNAGKELREAARISGKYGEKPGPLKTAVTEGRFEKVHLLSNYVDVIHKPFAKWLGCKPVIHPVQLA